MSLFYAAVQEDVFSDDLSEPEICLSISSFTNCPSAPLDSPIPAVVVFGTTNPLELLFEEGVPIGCALYILNKLSTILIEPEIKTLTPQLIENVVRVARTILHELVATRILYRDPFNPKERWIYEP
jgi:hypothetical protein